jgi:hypothetical protein
MAVIFHICSTGAWLANLKGKWSSVFVYSLIFCSETIAGLYNSEKNIKKILNRSPSDFPSFIHCAQAHLHSFFLSDSLSQQCHDNGVAYMKITSFNKQCKWSEQAPKPNCASCCLTKQSWFRYNTWALPNVRSCIILIHSLVIYVVLSNNYLPTLTNNPDIIFP